MAKVLAEISKSHAFEDPDHFLIATVFGKNSYYTVYLWNTSEIGNHCSSENAIFLLTSIRSVGILKE